jgi:hypothetical protein
MGEKFNNNDNDCGGNEMNRIKVIDDDKYDDEVEGIK